MPEQQTNAPQTQGVNPLANGQPSPQPQPQTGSADVPNGVNWNKVAYALMALGGALATGTGGVNYVAKIQESEKKITTLEERMESLGRGQERIEKSLERVDNRLDQLFQQSKR